MSKKLVKNLLFIMVGLTVCGNVFASEVKGVDKAKPASRSERYKTALSYYTNGNPELAFEILGKLAFENKNDELHNYINYYLGKIAVLYSHQSKNIFSKKDDALKRLEQAADQGLPRAQTDYGIYLFGDYPLKPSRLNKNRAKYYFTHAAAENSQDPIAKIYLAKICMNGQKEDDLSEKKRGSVHRSWFGIVNLVTLNKDRLGKLQQNLAGTCINEMNQDIADVCYDVYQRMKDDKFLRWDYSNRRYVKKPYDQKLAEEILEVAESLRASDTEKQSELPAEQVPVEISETAETKTERFLSKMRAWAGTGF